MKNDLISRSALLEDICESVVFSGRSGETSAEMRGAHKVVDRIKAALTVDAVPVVRCKYCHHSNCAYEGAQRYCRRHYGERIAVEDMGYCSWGERRSEWTKELAL